MLFMNILWKKFIIIKEIYDFFVHLNNFSLLTCTFLLFYFKQTLKIYKLQTSIILHISIPLPPLKKNNGRIGYKTIAIISGL